MIDLTVLAEETMDESDETTPNQDKTSQTYIQEAGTEEIAQPKMHRYVTEVEGTLRCLNCGSPIHWASDVCENCLVNPLRDRRESARISFRKTFVHDDLLAKFCNISRGGAQIKTRTSLSVGEFRKMAFSLGNAILVLKGTVVYVHSLSGGDLLAGIKFTELADRDLGLLNLILCSPVTQRYPG